MATPLLCITGTSFCIILYNFFFLSLLWINLSRAIGSPEIQRPIKLGFEKLHVSVVTFFLVKQFSCGYIIKQMSIFERGWIFYQIIYSIQKDKFKKTK